VEVAGAGVGFAPVVFPAWYSLRTAYPVTPSTLDAETPLSRGSASKVCVVQDRPRSVLTATAGAFFSSS
jgi:hypothetical protein